MSDDSVKNWQRPWSTEEIVNQADNWNLACDAALLNTLKAFGDRVLNISEGVHEKVENLCNNLTQISLRVDLARNEFNSICDSQFVECRVYEEDETLLIKEERKGKDEYDMTEDEKIEDLKNAVDLGLHILDEYYDKLEVPVSDSEEDEEVETPSYVYRRKDHYLHRPLPYVIGSEEWHKKWHVGLLESSDSEIEKSASDKFSDSEIDDDFEIKDQSDVSSEFSSAVDNSKSRSVGVSTINTSQPNDLFSSTGGPNLPSNIISDGSTFAEQLAAKLGTIVKENEALEESEVNRRPIHKKNSEYGALFSNEPPPFDNIVVKHQETDGVFSSGKGLFDDEDDDNDPLWSSDKSKNTSSTDYRVFSRDGQFAEKSFQSKGLFDEESDDDIFTENAYITNRMKNPYLQHIKPAIPPFHEEPPLLENEQDIKANKKLDGSVSGFEKSGTFQKNKLENISKKRIVYSSDECDEDTFCPNIMTEVSESNPIPVLETDERNFGSTTVKTHSNVQNISNAPKETKKVEDELQHKKTNNLKDIKPSDQEMIKPTNEASCLFDDIFADDLFSDTNKKFSSNLFTEEDLFPEESIRKTSEPNIKSSYSTSVITSTQTFSEISDDELFEEKQTNFKNHHDKSLKNISKNKTVSIFDDTDEDDFHMFVSKKSDTVNDQNTKNLAQSKVEVCASEDLDVYPEFEPLEQGELGVDIVPQEKIDRDELIAEKPFGQTYDGNSNMNFDKIHENTDGKYHKHYNWKQSSNIDEINAVQNILQEKHLPFDNETSKYNFTTQSKKTNDTISSIAYARSSDIPQVNFLDSTPPRDDGWDNNVNIFDDMEPYGVDDFQSRPSSLFDSEPPSLFLNDSSTVAQDVLENRIDCVKSFDPNLTPSRIFSSDIFSGTDDHSYEVSKNIEYSDTLIANSGNTWNTHSIPGIPDFFSESNTDLTAIGSSDYIHSSASVNPAGEEIYSKSIKREESKESVQVDVDTPDKFSGFSIQEPSCENEINSCDNKNNKKPTRCSLGKTDILKKKQNAGISIDGDRKIKIEIGNKISVSGANTDKINTGHSLLDDSFDIGVDNDIFSDSDALFAEDEISWKQPDNGIIASDVANIYIGKHVANSFKMSSTDSNENPVVSYNDESRKKDMSDMVFTHKTIQNNCEIIGKYPIETKPTATEFWPSSKKVHYEMEDTSTFEVEQGDDFSDASIRNGTNSISLIHDSYDNEAKNIRSELHTKKQDATYINDCIDKENVIRDNASVSKLVSFDENIVVNGNNSREPSVHWEESDEMQSNITKIVERLQQVSNVQENNSKFSALPGKISHKLDINVGALLPGSIPPRREKIQTPYTKTEELNNEEPDFLRTPISILRSQSETHPITREYTLEKSVSFDNAGEVEVLQNVTKNRPKIPIKRRPSSRKARQHHLRNSVPDFRIENESDLGETSTVKDSSSKNLMHNQPILVSQVSTSEEDINLQNKIIQSLEYLITTPELSLQIEKGMRNEPESRTLKADNSSEEQKDILLFNDEEDDGEDLFRIIQPNNGNAINHTKRVALKKKETPPLEPDTRTEEVEELLDPLDDNEFWKRSTSFPKTKSPFSSSGETGVIQSSSKRNENVKISTATLFDSSDEEDNFFNSLSKTKIGKQESNHSKTISNSKIGSELFDDRRTAEHDTEPSVIKKITPRSSNLRKLQNVEAKEDPLSAMLK